MAGEGGNKVRILDLPIDVSGEGASGTILIEGADPLKLPWVGLRPLKFIFKRLT